MLTRGVQKLLSLVEVQDSFAEAAERVLYVMSGLKVSAFALQRVAATAGRDLADKRSQRGTVGPTEQWS